MILSIPMPDLRSKSGDFRKEGQDDFYSIYPLIFWQYLIEYEVL
jgi:hypothetical protein